MPNKPRRPCKSPMCPNLCDAGYCVEHIGNKKINNYDSRRGTSAERGYDNNWRKFRLRFLTENPLCVKCLDDEQVTRATVVDHIIPHKGSRDLFNDATNHQALCKKCHDIKTISEGSFGKYKNGLYSSNLTRVIIPLTILSGPPGSGKTTYAQKNMGENDILIDLDIIMSEISRQPTHNVDVMYLNRAIAQRNTILQSLSKQSRYNKAWLISSSPYPHQRQFYRDKLGADRVVVFEINKEECKRRLRIDSTRINKIDMYCNAVDDWWSKYKTDNSDEVIRV